MLASTFAQFLAQSSSSDGGSVIASLVTLCCIGIFILIYLAAMWRIFEKANQPGFYALIPFVNQYILITQIFGRDLLWFILMTFTPLQILLFFDLAKVFGKDTLYGCLLWVFPPMFLVLAFGDAKYQGPIAG